MRPLDLLREIGRSELSRVERAVGTALVLVAENETWSWPRKTADSYGVSVRQLATRAGYSRRHTARGLRALEGRGLIETTFRPWLTSAYQLVREAWGQVAELVADPSSPARPDASLRVPGWARRATRDGERPETVLAVVEAVAAALAGAPVDATSQGVIARPVLRLWRLLGCPIPSSLGAQVAAVQAAATCEAPALARLRGVRGGRRLGPACAHRAAAILAVGGWSDRLAAAEAHAAGRCGCGAGAAVRAVLGATWSPPGQADRRAVVPADWPRVLADCDSQTALLLGAVEYAGVRDGHHVLQVGPHQDLAGIHELAGRTLHRALDGPVRYERSP